jgi:protein-L-isoaspartate(D-aspartate) O-methyltransferase
MQRLTWIALVVSFFLSAFAEAQNPAAPPNFPELRAAMVRDDLAGQGIKNERVLKAFLDTPRHELVSQKYRHLAYFDMAIPIGDSQTISGPFVVAYMTEQLDPQPTDKILEIGTGSGFQAAILSPLCKEVYTIEIVEQLGYTAKRSLERLKYKNVHVKVGDGFLGWPEHAPFDKIIVTCSPEKVPVPLVEQLKEGGRMVIPVGERYQQVLYLMKKEKGELVREILRPTLFVPMTGKAEDTRQVKPDPAHPKLNNPSFEELAGDSKEPVAWYYQRQMQIIDKDAPDGKQFVRFTNETPGRQTRMMQGLGLDGRKVRKIELSARVRCKDVRVGTERDQLPTINVIFFDENRSQLGINWIGPFQANTEWTTEKKTFDVPPLAREAIVNMGLLGATGQFDVDLVELRVPEPSK